MLQKAFSAMRYLSLHLPTLPTDRILRLRRASPKPPDAPFATIARIKGAYRLASLDAQAAKLKLRPGMALADARAQYPGLVVADADAVAEAACRVSIADWCRRFTPLAAFDPVNGIMLDVSGVAHLFGGEAALCDDIERRLAAQGFAARTGIGPGPEAAWALARFAHVKILPADIGTARLPRIFGDFPLAALGLGDEKIADLAQAGLRRIGDIVVRPRAPIAARFGAVLLARLDALMGMTKSAISPRFEAPAYVSERRFAEGLAHSHAIEATILTLAKDLCTLLERHGEGARQLGLTLFRVDGLVRHVDAGTSRPLRDPAAIARLFAERIEALGENGLETGYGFDVIRLAALVVERDGVAQAQLAVAADELAVTSPAAEAEMADLIDRLGARLGLRRITRLLPQGTHIPEFATVPVAASAVSAGAAAQQWQAAGLPAASGAPSRPVKLLHRPEPIDTIAAVPDGPPLRFRWRRIMHEVAAIEGPERIAPEWWKNAGADSLTRDYFRAEDRGGQRFWLFREGLFNAETARPRWYVHGLFA